MYEYGSQWNFHVEPWIGESAGSGTAATLRGGGYPWRRAGWRRDVRPVWRGHRAAGFRGHSRRKDSDRRAVQRGRGFGVDADTRGRKRISFGIARDVFARK